MKRIFISLIAACSFAVCFANDSTAVVIPDDGLHIYTTALLPKDKARVVVEGKVGKDAPEKTTAVVEIKYDGKTVWSFVRQMKKDKPFRTEKSLPLAKVWSVDNPVLYTASLTIYEGKQKLAERTDTFGITTSRIAVDTGLIVNDQYVKLRGVCLPANHWLYGSDKATWTGIIKMLKDFGCNAIRTESGAVEEQLLRACDETGMFLLADGADVIRLRNHPSIAMWLAGQQFTTNCNKTEIELIVAAAQAVRKADAYRPITAGMRQVDCSLYNGLTKELDLLGMNMSPFRYQETKNKTEQHLVLGAISDMHSNEERALFREHWVVGQFLYTDLTPIITKSDTFYIYRSLWNDKQHTLHISTSWNRTPGSSVSVTAYSDLKNVELLVNGKGIGRSVSLVWPDVKYETGIIEVVGYDKAGKMVAKTVRKTSEDVMRIEIDPSYAGRVSFVNFNMLDKNNTLCDNADNEVEIKMEGEGRLIGICLGERMIPADNNRITTKPYKGKITAVVEGNGQISATSDNIIGGMLQINHNN